MLIQNKVFFLRLIALSILLAGGIGGVYLPYASAQEFAARHQSVATTPTESVEEMVALLVGRTWSLVPNPQMQQMHGPFKDAESLFFTQKCLMQGDGKKIAYRLQKTRASGGWLFLANGSALGFEFPNKNTLLVAGHLFKASTAESPQQKMGDPLAIFNTFLDGLAAIEPCSCFKTFSGTSWESCCDSRLGPDISPDKLVFGADGILTQARGGKSKTSLWSVDNSYGAQELFEHSADSTRITVDSAWSPQFKQWVPKEFYPINFSTLYRNSDENYFVNALPKILKLKEGYYREISELSKTTGLKILGANHDEGTTLKLTYDLPLKYDQPTQVQFSIIFSDRYLKELKRTNLNIPSELYIEQTTDALLPANDVRKILLKVPPHDSASSLPNEQRTGTFSLVLHKERTSLMTLFIRDDGGNQFSGNHTAKSWTLYLKSNRAQKTPRLE
ncbi:MAG: hypothetical protein P4L53_28080 [Candidatus Obscuribacterales bacterium]|nr:hypothetical protein [Candidatus Obscuribacterales bacterium]